MLLQLDDTVDVGITVNKSNNDSTFFYTNTRESISIGLNKYTPSLCIVL